MVLHWLSNPLATIFVLQRNLLCFSFLLSVVSRFGESFSSLREFDNNIHLVCVRVSVCEWFLDQYRVKIPYRVS